MKFTPVVFTCVLLATQIHPTLAGNHDAYLASVSTYKPMAGFNHVVGPTRFVGYFLLAQDACRVTVFKAAANDESLVSPPERIELYIVAADRRELAAGDGSSLAIACTADADAIKIAPQQQDWSVSRTPCRGAACGRVAPQPPAGALR